jgi:hypothetical protein
MVMLKYIFILYWCLFSVSLISAQAVNEQELKQKYEARIKLARIDDVYIPKNTEDALEQLFKLSDSTGRNKMKATTEDIIASKLHFSLGRWIELNWSLVEGSRLSHYYRLKGMSHPDDIVDLLLRGLYRKVNGKELDEAGLIKKYVDKRKSEHEAELRKAKAIKS